MRVARHATTIKELIRTFSGLTSGRVIEVDGDPGYDDIVKPDIGSFRQQPGESRRVTRSTS